MLSHSSLRLCGLAKAVRLDYLAAYSRAHRGARRDDRPVVTACIRSGLYRPFIARINRQLPGVVECGKKKCQEIDLSSGPRLRDES